MNLGFDKAKVLEGWEGTKEVFRGNMIWDPFRQRYVRIDPGQTSIGDAGLARLALPQPNPMDDRLLHIKALEEAGIIDAQQAAQARSMILSQAA
jgi:hypothetical protein